MSWAKSWRTWPIIRSPCRKDLVAYSWNVTHTHTHTHTHTCCKGLESASQWISTRPCVRGCQLFPAQLIIRKPVFTALSRCLHAPIQAPQTPTAVCVEKEAWVGRLALSLPFKFWLQGKFKVTVVIFSETASHLLGFVYWCFLWCCGVKYDVLWVCYWQVDGYEWCKE